MKTILSICLLALLTSLSVAQERPASGTAESNPYNLPDGLYSEITTPKGVIVCELYYKKTPMTVANYVGLGEGTLGPEPRVPYFDGSPYHRIVRGYVVQGGSPPRGGERSARLGYEFPDEFVPGLRHDSVGVMQMANSGPGTNGAQHCLMLGPAQRLNYLHTVFGHTVRGEEILPKIEINDVMQVKILRIGNDAQAFRADEETFKALVAKAKTVEGPFGPQPTSHFYDPDGLLPTNVPRATHFNMKLMNFEKFTGQKIVAHLHATAPVSGVRTFIEYLGEVARACGVERSGIYATYFADEDRWYLLVRPESEAAFIAGPRKPDGTKDPVPANKTLNEATIECRARVEKLAAELIKSAENAVPPNDSVEAKQKLKLRVDAMLDELIFRLEPAAG